MIRRSVTTVDGLAAKCEPLHASLVILERWPVHLTVTSSQQSPSDYCCAPTRSRAPFGKTITGVYNHLRSPTLLRSYHTCPSSQLVQPSDTAAYPPESPHPTSSHFLSMIHISTRLAYPRPDHVSFSWRMREGNWRKLYVLCSSIGLIARADHERRCFSCPSFDQKLESDTSIPTRVSSISSLCRVSRLSHWYSCTCTTRLHGVPMSEESRITRQGHLVAP
jgi:hypothetical protein